MIDSAILARARAPTGKLRASINVGNPVLARQDTATVSPCGVSIDIAGAPAERLGTEVEFVVFTSAQQSVDAVADGQGATLVSPAA